MQIFTDSQVPCFETIPSGDLDRVVGSCGNRRGDIYGGGTPGSSTGGPQYTPESTPSYQAGGTDAGSENAAAPSSRTLSTSGLMSLIEPLRTLTQALQAFEQVVTSASSTAT